MGPAAEQLTPLLKAEGPGEGTNIIPDLAGKERPRGRALPVTNPTASLENVTVTHVPPMER